MRAVDTNVLVRLLARDGARQVALAEAFVGRGAWVSLIVLVEALWVLTSAYEMDSSRVATAVELLLDHQQFALQDAETVRAALALFKESAGVGFSDCLLLEVARKAGHLPLGTLDHDLSKLDGAQRLPAR